MTISTVALAVVLAVSTVDLPDISKALARSDGSTDHTKIASLLDGLRSLGHRAAPAGNMLSAMLNHRHPIYAERDKSLVTRLRTHIFVTLSEIGTPDSAVVPLLDVLAYFDVRMNPAEVGAAVRAAGSMGSRGQPFTHYLLEMLDEPISVQEFSLSQYEPGFERKDATTLQIEVIRTLGRICMPYDTDAIHRLRQFVSNGASSRGDNRVVGEALAAIKRIEGGGR